MATKGKAAPSQVPPPAPKNGRKTKRAPGAGDIDKKWFFEQMEAQHLTLRTLAPRLDMDAPALSKLFGGERKMSAAEAADMARELNVKVEEVMRRAGINVPAMIARGIPVEGWVDGQGVIHPGQVLGPRVVNAPESAGEGLSAVRYQAGGPMDGWLFFWRPTAGITPEAVGQISVVKVLGEENSRLCWLRRGYEEGKWILGPVDDSRQTMAEARITSASKVTFMKP